MLGAAQMTGRLVGHEEVTYDPFTDGSGRKVEGGVTHWLTLAAPGTGETSRLKCKEADAELLRDAWWGGEVTVRVKAFAKNNRVTYVIVSVVDVQPCLPGFEG